eukprot:CAMPEP_0174371832 /NCGR_PEP_ID=MMETSP0811_2-20130205/101250_1 /TAXON_ID=73025 ORGANISM="Eutreptiella gymnastica-like, Strain CCMP1594" /NCGR_SAMPLE_ID=MMETSP0811_2 /ASSEMBLY_ACC=CAM_ASM_000667 /LENGTH=63 /DNA_ID=CAMNT_0015518631 /DNA_START=356 /DNA_END=547 /DNA_ORIENTATION=+
MAPGSRGHQTHHPEVLGHKSRECVQNCLTVAACASLELSRAPLCAVRALPRRVPELAMASSEE